MLLPLQVCQVCQVWPVLPKPHRLTHFSDASLCHFDLCKYGLLHHCVSLCSICLMNYVHQAVLSFPDCLWVSCCCAVITVVLPGLLFFQSLQQSLRHQSNDGLTHSRPLLPAAGNPPGHILNHYFNGCPTISWRSITRRKRTLLEK